MKLSEVDGEEYLSFLYNLLFIYTFFYTNDAKVDWHDVCVCTPKMHVAHTDLKTRLQTPVVISERPAE